jgi:16S rRNA (uracil1498-N3)-methyltransferase
LRRFTIAPDRYHDGVVTFDRDETRHLVRVLRLGPGDTVIAFDGRGHDYTVRLETLGETATGTVMDVAVREEDSRLGITLVQGIPKGDKMEAIVRAATELGVRRLLPAITERTIVRLEPSRWRERARRWQRVAREAAKQSRRTHVPDVELPAPLAAIVARPPTVATALRLCLWEGEAPPLRTVLDASPGVSDVDVIVGPEGGLSRAEVDAARAAGWNVASLGARILRTETVAPALLAVLQFHLGDLGGP